MELHIKIRAARHQFGFSQQYMADLLNISQKAYSKIESGKTALTIKRVTEIAKIFKIHPHRIAVFRFEYCARKSEN